MLRHHFRFPLKVSNGKETIQKSNDTKEISTLTFSSMSPFYSIYPIADAHFIPLFITIFCNGFHNENNDCGELWSE